MGDGATWEWNENKNVKESEPSRDVVRHDDGFGDVAGWDVALDDLGPHGRGRGGGGGSMDGHLRGDGHGLPLSCPGTSHRLVMKEHNTVINILKWRILIIMHIDDTLVEL